jgi:hypothetical protein
MNLTFPHVWASLPKLERTLTIIILLLVWGGIAVAVLLSALRLIDDPGSFFWGCIAGSFILAYLARIKKKLDFVSLLTPVYALITFMGLEIKPTLLLQTLFAASLTVLLYRLHISFSHEKEKPVLSSELPEDPEDDDASEPNYSESIQKE